MSHKHRTVQFSTVLFLAGILAVCSTGRAYGLPNIVYVIQDALRADKVDAERNGVPLAPYMKSMAAAGLRFTNAVAPSTWTMPSMESVFTCRYVDTNGTYGEWQSMPESVETMAEYFKQAGYTTVGIQVSDYLAPAYGFAQGFDRYDMLSAADAATMTAHAIEVVQAGLTEPFFIYIHYAGPHFPYNPPQTYREMLGYPNPGLTQAERAIAEDFMPYILDHIGHLIGIKPTLDFTPLSPIGEEAVETLYDGKVRCSDDKVGQFVDAVKGKYPNTVFAMSADHGEHFWEHDYLVHAMTVYNALIDVPLVLEGPGIPVGQVNSDNVSTISLLPTFADLLGLPVRSQWQAKSLFAPHDPAGPTFSYTSGTTAPYDVDLEMVKLGSMKLIRDRRTNGLELYNVAADPGELVNLISTYPETANQLKALLDKHLQENVRERGVVGSVIADPSGWVEEGATITLTAPEGSGYVWLKNGEALSDEASHVAGSNQRTLVLSQVEIQDGGRFECMYDTGGKATASNLAMTQAYVLAIAPAGSLPVASPAGLAVLALLLAGAQRIQLLRR